ncbi:ABC transporter permease [Spirosoma jeollabukense]
MLYVQQELSYDNYHQNANRIFRLTTRLTTDGKENHTAWTPNFIGEQIRTDYAEVETIIRLQANSGKTTFKLVPHSTAKAPRLVSIDQVYNVYDPVFLQVFTYPMLEGDLQTALIRPGSAVITESVARKFFGLDWQVGKGILGEVIQSGGNTYQITGVLRDIPSATDMPFQVLLSQDAEKLENQAWCILYVLFKQSNNGASFPPKLDHIAQKIQPDFAKRGGHIAFALENLKDIHLGEPKLFDTPKANRAYLIIFSIVAGFLLLIASINYINLSLAQSVGRSREVGVRKAIGAARFQLLGLFLGESLLLTGVALVLSLILVILLLPIYNELADTHFSLVSLLNWPIASLLGAIFIILGVLAGSYPASYLSSFEPVSALKGKLRLGGKSAKVQLGQGLVVLQFTISITIIIGTLVVYKQLHYLQHKNLGFQREQVLVLDVPPAAASGAISTLKKALSELTYLRAVALSGSNSLPSQEMNLSAFNLEKDGKMLPLPQRSIDIDENYLAVLGIPLVAGRNFTTVKLSAEKPGEAIHDVMVNETLVKKMGWGPGPEAALGKSLSQGPTGEETWRGSVVGVIKDFHFQSPHKPIEPMVLQNNAEQFPQKILVRLSAGQLPLQINLVESQWEKVVPNQAFDFTFLDATFEKQYRQERRLVTIFTYFSLLTIIVACLGLYGLSSFATAQRTKEVGVRKVMGANESGLIYLLSKEFLRLVGLAILLASPLAWFAMNRWLQEFAYQTSIGLGEFVMAGGVALLIAALTTGYHAIRLARRNPVRALRHE